MIDVDCMDIIAGRATPPGKGAIAVIRVSGKGSFNVISQHISSKIPVTRMKYFHLYRAEYFGGKSRNNPLDDIMVALMPEGRSYTSEEMVEIFCHGGMGVVFSILRTLLACGVRVAEPGEFTYRAFRNGRIDLLQAEGIGILAESKSSASLEAATALATGKISKTTKSWHEKLTEILADMEAGIDFAVEESEETAIQEQSRSIEKVIDEMSGFLGHAFSDRQFMDGPRVVIAGCSNCGKTTLLNKLAKRNAGLEDALPGTTRDSIEVYLDIEGEDLVLIDTAGFGYTEDPLCKQTRKLAKKSIEEADIVIHLIDAEKGMCSDDEIITRLSGGCNSIRVWNKIDIVPEIEIQYGEEDVCISALTGENMETFKEEIGRRIRELKHNQGGNITLLTYRQSVHVKDAVDSLTRARDAIYDGFSEEVSAQEIRDALESLGKLTGRRIDEEVLGNIFSRFCIGK